VVVTPFSSLCLLLMNAWRSWGGAAQSQKVGAKRHQCCVCTMPCTLADRDKVSKRPACQPIVWQSCTTYTINGVCCIHYLVYTINYVRGICKKCTNRQILFFLNFRNTAVHEQQNTGNVHPMFSGTYTHKTQQTASLKSQTKGGSKKNSLQG
jgi:hypothetical protein